MRKALHMMVISTLALSGRAVNAHHSAAMFDSTSLITITGTVKEFQWTQPHCWLVIEVPEGGGASPKEWRIESGAPTIIGRLGIRKSTFPAGSKVTVAFHPLKDGGAAGEFVSVITADGQRYGFGPRPTDSATPPAR